METKGYERETMFALNRLLAETTEETCWICQRQAYPFALGLKPFVTITRGECNFSSIQMTMSYLFTVAC